MIKVGILGTGFGKVHADIYRKLEGVEIAGIFGRKEGTLNELKEKLSVKVTADPDELILDPSIDLIDVCLPTAVHKEYVIKALKNNKHVFCETPVSYTLEEAEEMKEYSKKYNRKLFVDLFFKFSAPHQFAIERIKSDYLGKPFIVTAYQQTPPHWGDMNINELVQDFMIHNFDFITEIMGTPLEITAKGVEKGNSHIISTLEYETGLSCVESSTMLPSSFPFSIGFNVICESGTITYNGQFSEKTTQRMIVYKNEVQEEISLPGNDDYEEAIKHVLANIREGQSGSCISIDEAIKSLKIALAIKKSISNNCPINISGYQ